MTPACCCGRISSREIWEEYLDVFWGEEEGEYQRNIPELVVDSKFGASKTCSRNRRNDAVRSTFKSSHGIKVFCINEQHTSILFGKFSKKAEFVLHCSLETLLNPIHPLMMTVRRHCKDRHIPLDYYSYKIHAVVESNQQAIMEISEWMAGFPRAKKRRCW